MNRETAAYLAGMLEVGGWIGLRDGQPGIQINAPLEVCNGLMRRTSAGNVYGSTKPVAPGVPRLATWSVQDKDSVAIILQQVAPLLSKVRQQEAARVMYLGYDAPQEER